MELGGEGCCFEGSDSLQRRIDDCERGRPPPIPTTRTAGRGVVVEGGGGCYYPGGGGLLFSLWGGVMSPEGE